MDQKTADMLREKYPNHIPLEVAAEYLDVSPRQLSKLIAEGRQPFASFGANIGISRNIPGFIPKDLLLTRWPAI